MPQVTSVPHPSAALPLGGARNAPHTTEVSEHTIEIVSDAGEGAQKCGQIFGAVSARMGNGAWTVEIIPAEIQPPPRTPAGGSGNRIRIGTRLPVVCPMRVDDELCAMGPIRARGPGHGDRQERVE